MQACLDPLSQSAQKVATPLKYIRDHLGARIDLLLNPQVALVDLPLKSYYAYAFPEPAATADAGGSGGDAPPPLSPVPARVWFPRLPSRRVLTLNIAVPEAWLVEVRACARPSAKPPLAAAARRRCGTDQQTKYRARAHWRRVRLSPPPAPPVLPSTAVAVLVD